MADYSCAFLSLYSNTSKGRLHSVSGFLDTPLSYPGPSTRKASQALYPS